MNPARIQKNCARVIPVILVLMVSSVLPASGVNVTDDAGTTIALNATPSRIVSLAHPIPRSLLPLAFSTGWWG